MADLRVVQELLPLRSCIVTLRWLEASAPGFLHHVALHAWVRNLAGSPDGFSNYLIVEPLENGHIQYVSGDGYCFRLTALSGGESLLALLFEQLKRLPISVTNKQRSQHFADNLKLVEIEDSFEGHCVNGVADLTCFDANSLLLETSLWASQPFFKLAFTTPARLVRDKLSEKEDEAPVAPSGRGKQRFCRDRNHLSWSLISQRVTDTIINLYQHRTGNRLQRTPWPEAQIHTALAFWIDHSYSKNANGKPKDASGLLGQVHLSLAPDYPLDLLLLLVLGQYTGIGQNRSFGMGQYQLMNERREVTYPRPPAYKSLLDNSFDNPNLAQACEQMYGRRQESDWERSDEEHAAAKTTLFIELQEKCKGIKQQIYHPAPLQPMEIDKPDGGTRLLSIPSWHDRTLQRAVTDLLGPTLDQLWMKHSYGYRRGHSRQNARDEINRQIQNGYQWVLESDIDNFFDSVCWQNLQQRLTLLFPNEPLVPLLMQWVQCQREENEIDSRTRVKGLPQGAPISPLLANLLLDDFDQDMLAKGHNIVRYADDFVMLFKTEAEAQLALPDIQASLQEHGLDINLDKTSILPAKSGFRYLGYLFIDGYAIETDKANASLLQHDTSLAGTPPKEPEREGIGERDSFGTVLIVAGDVAMLFSDKNRLVVEQYDTKNSYCWNSLAAIFLIGPHQITTPALKVAMTKGVAVHFADNFGRYQGVAAGQFPHQLGVNFGLVQTQYLQHEHNALEISRELVNARLAGQNKLIKRRDSRAPELDKYHRIADKIARASTLQQLRGYEGEAAKLLWQFLQRYLDPEWGFKGRNRRPPKDPVNAMLSLGYSFLYGLVDSINRVVGLHPWQGAYHQNSGRHQTLSSDLMEPYRYLVERTVLTLINRGQIKPEAFAVAAEGCQMSSEARKTLLHELLVQLTRDSGKSPCLMSSIKDQALSLAIACKTGQRFQAWRPR